MRILQINSFFSAGGPPRIVKGIYDTVLRNGGECLLAASREKPESGMDIYRIGNAVTTYSCAIQARVFDNDGFAAKKATNKLIERIKTYQPDLIHLHNLHSYYINTEILFNYLKHCEKPIVWTFHDCWPMTGHCPHFTMVNCNRYITGCYNCPQRHEFPASYVMDRSKRNWEKKKELFSHVPNLNIVCVSKWLESIVKGSYMKNYPTTVIYNGLDLRPFRHINSNFRQEKNLEGKRLILGVALHWMARKGLYDFIELAKLLDDSYRIVLVGIAEGEIKGLPNNILPISAIYDDAKLAEIYSACDLYLNLSYEETFGMTSVESLACGTPIITYDMTAVPEVANFFEAPIVKAGDICELKHAVESHFRDYDYSRTYDVSFFDEKNQYQRYYDLYEDLLNSKRR